jgi:S-DNA-T family DNA segregation ATPase FtsK/SpoIIIE
MIIIGRHGRGEVDVHVRVSRPEATVADLAAALRARFDLESDDGICVDGRRVGPDMRLEDAGLRDGSVVAFGGAGNGAAPPLDSPVLAVVGGCDSGVRRALPPGAPLILGRGSGADVSLGSDTVSRRHAQIGLNASGVVVVADLGSRNGTWIGESPIAGTIRLSAGDVVRAGACRFVVRSEPADRPSGIGTAGVFRGPFNRPPRRSAPPPAPRLQIPSSPPPHPSPVPIGVVSIAGPLLFAALMVVVMRNPAFALFAVLAPILVVGNTLEARRRGRRGAVREQRRYRAALDRLAADIASAAESETVRLAAAHPDLGEVVRRATAPSTRLWERRPPDEDFLQVRLGTADQHWTPAVAVDASGRSPPVHALPTEARLVDAPVVVDLAAGPLGIAGPRGPAISLARAVVLQAAVHHGPADLAIRVLASADTASDWDSVKWLPHARRDGGPTLLVADGTELPRRDPTNAPAPMVVVAASVDRLPASCDAVVELEGPDGHGTVTWPRAGRACDGLRIDGVSAATLRTVAVALARVDDPDVDTTTSRLPDRVRLADLLEGGIDVFGVLGRWNAHARASDAAVPLGMSASGPFGLDLACDGPHALVAGTTGAGKSELLRTLVAGLAASTDPDRLTFVLVDFKGGSAFDACARLPHTVGLVTDLDEHLAARALRCLEAELRYRERRLRAAGAVDLGGYIARAGADAAPLPRLVVVVDEFATLRAELPDFVDALVGIAQRGRSLGVHLVLATQRPSGAVSDNIRANTNIRVALRVQDGADSTDVLGCPDAATIARQRPGQAYVRLGPGEIVAIQTALASAPYGGERAAVEIVPFEFAGETVVDAPAADAGGAAGPTDLSVLVDSIVDAFVSTGRPPPRRPWPDPLPPTVDLDALPAGAVALADDPDAQCQLPWSWDAAGGHLLMYGAAGSGTSTALATVALATAAAQPPDAVHLYVVDCGAGALAPLARLPHTGAWIAAAERERQARLMRMLRAEIERRRTTGAARDPLVVTLINGFGALAANFADVAGMAVMEDVARVFADGPEVGVVAAVAADRPGAVPTSIAALVRHRLVLRLADPFDYGALGLPSRNVPPMPPGRALVAETGQLMQIARLSKDGREWIAARGHPPPAVSPAPVGSLPDRVPLGDIPCVDGSPAATLTIGIGERDLGPAVIEIHDGDHVLVAGPPRSGRSAALRTIAAAARRTWPDVTVLTVAGRRASLEELQPRVDELDGRVLVVLDDAESIDDEAGVLANLANGTTNACVHLVVAGRSDALRTQYAHWTRLVRRSRLGVLLQPNPDLDGDLLGVQLPRRAPVPMVRGRGYVVNGSDVELAQLAVVE